MKIIKEKEKTLKNKPIEETVPAAALEQGNGSEGAVPMIKKKTLIVALSSAGGAAIVAIAVLGILLFQQAGQTRKYQTESLQYQQTLSETEEGKRQLQAANEKLGKENEALDAEAASAKDQAEAANQRAEEADQKALEAEQLAADAQQKADQAAANLKAKQAELASVSSNLSARQQELEKANRGIAKFDELEELFIQFAKDADTLNMALDEGWLALVYGDQQSYNYYVELIETTGAHIDNVASQIRDIFTVIENQQY